MVDTTPAPGDVIVIGGRAWTVQAVWQRCDGDYQAETWVEVYDPGRGRWMTRAGDEGGRLYRPPV